MKINYKTQDTCSRSIEVEVEGGVVKDVHYECIDC